MTEAAAYVFDLGRGTLTRLAAKGEADWPVWSPDGRRVVFAWLEDGRPGLAMQSADADATSTPRVLLRTDLQPTSWTPDGTKVAGVLLSGWDIAVVTDLDGRPSVQPLWPSSDIEMGPQLSPDGAWVAYESDASGRQEIWVRPYPGQERAQRVSVDGGTGPAWNPNGREISFAALPDATGKRRMMAAQFSAGSSPVPHALFAFTDGELSLGASVGRHYDVSRDGQRFYTFRNRPWPPRPIVTQIDLIQNWLEALKAKVPVKR